jgi:hypothetical protein
MGKNGEVLFDTPKPTAGVAPTEEEGVNVSSTISNTLEMYMRGNLVLSYSSAFYNYSIALLNNLRTKFVQEHTITK